MRKRTVLFCSLVLCIVTLMFFSQKAEASFVMNFDPPVFTPDPEQGDADHTYNYLSSDGWVTFNGRIWRTLGSGAIPDHTTGLPPGTTGAGYFLRNTGVQPLVTITFSFDVSSIELYWRATSGVVMWGAVYDINGGLINESSGGDVGSDAWVLAIPNNSTTPIRSIAFWSDTSTGLRMGIDDLTIFTTNVPEPATMLLLGLGLVGLAGIRRKFKK